MQERRQQPWDFLLGLFERAYNVSRFPGFLTSVCHFIYYISDRLHNSSLIIFSLYLLTCTKMQNCSADCSREATRTRSGPEANADIAGVGVGIITTFTRF